MSVDEYNRLITLSGSDAERLDTKLRITFDTIATMVAVLNPDLTIRRVNRAFCNYLNEQENELVGRDFATVRSSPTLTFVASRAQAVLDTGREETFEIASEVRANRMLAVQMRPWPTGVVMFVNDITDRIENHDRKPRDVALDASLEKIGNVGISYMDARGEIQLASLSLAHAIGIGVEQLAGRSFLNTLVPTDRTDLADKLRIAKTPFVMPVKLLYKGSEVYAATLSVVPFANMHGTNDFAFSVCRETKSSY